ncbi:MAG: hypothetical protein WC958_01565 [Dehalococcoidales bacterium]|jgi:hypothetical protein
MSDILDEAYGIIQCKECPWYKMCLIPMKFTTEDIRRQMENTPGFGSPEKDNPQMSQLISSMAYSAQQSMVEGCPIFIERLRKNPKLAQRIKEIMINWSSEGDE